MIPLDDQLRPTWLFGATVHEGCDRAGYYEQGDFATEYGSPKCIVKLGCWGPVVKCNVPKRGWINGVGGCPNVGGICIGCTMPGFPDKFMPFMDEPPGGKVSTTASGAYGARDPAAARHHDEDRRQGAEVAPQGRTDHRLPEELVRGTAMTKIQDSPAQTETVDSDVVEMSWDPITRIVGSLGIYATVDFKQKNVRECHSTSSIFRGYSIFMKGKDPRDAHFITSRICGICGDNHATCSVYAQNMAYGVQPPHLGELIINLGEAAEYMFDHNIFQENLVGVDYCERMVSETNPGVLELANRTESPHAGDHGYKTIGDIMRSLNPIEGDFYREALQVSRYTREMFCLMEGRHVHPSTLYPGGVGTTATVQLFTDYYTRLMRYCEFLKKVVPLHDDLFDFFYEALPGYEHVGERRVLLGCWGAFQDPEVCDFTYRKMADVGPRDGRHARASSSTASSSRTAWSTSTSACASCSATPTTTTGPTAAHEKFVDKDPLGNPIDVHHPWNQHTLPKPGKRDFDAAYSWTMSPRWFDGTDHLALDTGGGPIARLWSTALSGLVEHELRQGHRAQRHLRAAADGAAAGDELRVEDPAVEQRARAQPGADLLPALRRVRRARLHRARHWPRSGPGAPRRGRRSPSRTRRSAAGSPRPCAACSATTW